MAGVFAARRQITKSTKKLQEGVAETVEYNVSAFIFVTHADYTPIWNGVKKIYYRCLRIRRAFRFTLDVQTILLIRCDNVEWRMTSGGACRNKAEFS
jgi:hypothetical protein